MRALDAEGVMYARTHSKRSSVGSEGDSSGSSPDPKSGFNETTGGVRRSTGRRLYTGERSAVPPPPIRCTHNVSRHIKEMKRRRTDCNCIWTTQRRAQHFVLSNYHSLARGIFSKVEFDILV